MGIMYPPFETKNEKSIRKKITIFLLQNLSLHFGPPPTPYIYAKRILLVPTGTGHPNEDIHAGFTCLRWKRGVCQVDFWRDVDMTWIEYDFTLRSSGGTKSCEFFIFRYPQPKMNERCIRAEKMRFQTI